MPDSSEILARLRSPGQTRRLASLVVDDILGRALGDLVDRQRLVATVGEALRALTASDAAALGIARQLEEATAALAVEQRPLSAIAAKPLGDGMRALALLPMTPGRDVVLKLLDREPLRRLLRVQVLRTLVDFGRRAASPALDSPIGRGLGGISKMAFGQLASRSSSLGRVASAVSNEVERQVEKRAAEFADTAVSGILEGIADQASDPSLADEQAAVRAALVDGLLELTGAEVAALGRGQAGAQVGAVRTALRAWVESPPFATEADAAVRIAVGREASRPLGELLADLDLRDIVTEHARVAVERAVAHVVSGDAFAEWLAELCAP
jgi:hypothetical protein